MNLLSRYFFLKNINSRFLYIQGVYEKELENKIEKATTEIEEFIKILPHASDADKAWNLQDARKRLAQGESVDDLMQKYEFYDGIAVLREQILTNIPQEKQRLILQKIHEIIDERTNGMGRELKRGKLESIKVAVDLFFQEQTLRRHKLWRTQHLPPLGVQVYKALLAKDSERFKKEYEDVFTKEFWGGIYGIFSKDFPGVVNAFPYPTENDFLSDFQNIDELKKFLENLKKSAVEDAKQNLKEFFSVEEAKKLQDQLNGIPANKPADTVKYLHRLHDQKVKYIEEAKNGFERTKKLSFTGDYEATYSELETLEKKFGKGVMKDLGQVRFKYQLLVDLANERRLKKEAKSAKGAKKIKIEKKIESQRKGKEYLAAKEKLSKAEKAEKAKELNVQLDKYLSINNFIGARAVAHRLQRVDSDEASQAMKRVNEEAQKDSNTKKEPKESEDTSVEKQKKVDFLELCIEHMKKVMEHCNTLGIPKDDPDFWGLDGIKNRVEWLRKNGMYETYKKFNSSDPHVPSTAQAGGFKFRWLDLKTGTSLTGSSAEAGTKFLKRFNDSGYQLAVLAGAFSMNWKGASDPVYAPEKYMRLIQEELNNVKAGK